MDSAPRGCHKLPYPGAHTRTCGAIWAYVLGPMPSTSCSSSIRLNRPCCCRHARMAPAVTGPIPGSCSSCAWLARFRSSVALAEGLAASTRLSAVSHLPRRIAGGTDYHLLAIRERLSEVQLTRIGSTCQPTCCVNRILDTRVLRELDQPWVADRAEHMDDEPGRALTSRGRCYW